MVSPSDRRKAADILKKRAIAKKGLVEGSPTLDEQPSDDRRRKAAKKAERGAVAGFGIKRSG